MKTKKNVIYTDAAFYSGKNASIVIIDHEGAIKDCLTLKDTTADEAETGALLLAIRYGQHKNQSLQIVTDSKKAKTL